MTSGRRGAGSSVFAAVLSVTCTAGILSGCSQPPAATATNGISSPAPVNSQGTSNADAAEQVAAWAVALVKLPRSATSISPPSSGSATGDARSVGPDVYLAREQRWYSVPTTVTALLGYVADRVPTGFIADGRADSDVYFEAAATAQYDAPEVDVSATQDGKRAIVTVDATVSWRPLRSPEELVPDTVTSATLVENGTGGEPRTVGLGPSEARALAKVFNSLWAVSPPLYPLACAMGATITASFNGPSGRIDFTPDCTGIGVLANGVSQPDLETSYALLPVRDAYFAFAASPPPPPMPPSPNPSSLSPAPSTAATLASSTGPHIVLTNADDNRAVAVAVGTTIEVVLAVDPPTTVDPALADGDFVLEPLDFSSGSTSVSEASFRAAATGKIKLFAMTRPVCAGDACGAAPVFVFDVTVRAVG